MYPVAEGQFGTGDCVRGYLVVRTVREIFSDPVSEFDDGHGDVSCAAIMSCGPPKPAAAWLCGGKPCVTIGKSPETDAGPVVGIYSSASMDGADMTGDP
jgi:hypothetical protein